MVSQANSVGFSAIPYGRGDATVIDPVITLEIPPSRPSARERPGDLVDQRYRIVSELARGGMGTVFLATQIGLERPVAIKAIAGADGEQLERLRREAVALADVAHPAVVELLEFLDVKRRGERRCYLVMSYIAGENLDKYAASRPSMRIPAQELIGLFLPVASALVALHRKSILHRDLKPNNLMRARRPDGKPYLTLVDFGIARRKLDSDLTRVGAVIGTPVYMAPETLLGERHTDKSDIYSLGVTLYELATGNLPRTGTSPQRLIRQMMREPLKLPPALRSTPFGTLLTGMLAVSSSERPTAGQVLRALEKLQRGSARDAKHRPAAIPPPRRRTRTEPPPAPLAQRPIRGFPTVHPDDASRSDSPTRDLRTGRPDAVRRSDDTDVFARAAKKSQVSVRTGPSPVLRELTWNANDDTDDDEQTWDLDLDTAPRRSTTLARVGRFAMTMVLLAAAAVVLFGTWQFSISQRTAPTNAQLDYAASVHTQSP